MADPRFSPASVSERLLEVAPGVTLRALDISPPAPRSPQVVVFVAGWFSAVDGWLGFLRRLAQSRRIVYLETREKASSRIALGRRPTPADFTLDSLARDLAAAVAALDIPPDRLVLAGSSLGATVIHRALAGGLVRARAAILIGATAEFRFPWIGRVVLRLMPASSWAFWRPITLWYLRMFRVDTRREPEQMKRYQGTLAIADPLKLKLSSLAFADMREPAAAIEVPTLFAYAQTDKLHGVALIEELAAPMPRATLRACPSNRFLHDAEMADIATGWLDQAALNAHTAA
jgi:pimeloyl-ACP methyl ester carboxylesterase